ncbi:MAG: hypothetical protein JWM11_7409 [Planctomycetaceae bacterium]|nr:hypothetical protein [Planctomycetaceae bacterium]
MKQGNIRRVPPLSIAFIQIIAERVMDLLRPLNQAQLVKREGTVKSGRNFRT